MSGDCEPVKFPAAPAARRRRPKLFEAPAFRQVDFFTVGGGGTVSPAPRCRPENDAVYAAVQKLRAAGVKVFRVSADQHRAGGRLVSTRQLLELAAHAN